MKKVLIVFAAATLFILAGCTKTKQCTCKVSQSGYEGSTVYEAWEGDCKALNATTTVHTPYGDATTTTTCE